MVRKSSPARAFGFLARSAGSVGPLEPLTLSRISTASRRSSASSGGEVLVGELAGGVVELGVADLAVLGFLQRVGLGPDEGAAAAAARRPERDQRPRQGDQAADPHPGDQRVDDHLEGRRRARRSGSCWAMRSIGQRPAAAAICASARGCSAGSARAARISRRQRLALRRRPGRAAHAGFEPFVGRPHPPLHGRDVGLHRGPDVLARRLPRSPTSLVASPSKKLPIVPGLLPGRAEVAPARGAASPTTLPSSLDPQHGAELEVLVGDVDGRLHVGDLAAVDRRRSPPAAGRRSRLVWKLEEAAMPISRTITPMWTM